MSETTLDEYGINEDLLPDPIIDPELDTLKIELNKLRKQFKEETDRERQERIYLHFEKTHDEFVRLKRHKRLKQGKK